MTWLITVATELETHGALVSAFAASVVAVGLSMTVSWWALVIALPVWAAAVGYVIFHAARSPGTQVAWVVGPDGARRVVCSLSRCRRDGAQVIDGVLSVKMAPGWEAVLALEPGGHHDEGRHGHGTR